MKAIVLCSGGIDSVVTAHFVKGTKNYSEITVVFFNYGQNSLEFERKFAKQCAKDINASFFEYDVSESGIYGDLPKENNTEVSRKDLASTEKHSKKHYIPGRNLLFLSYTLSLAERLSLEGKEDVDIFVGFISEGRDSYPDTTKEFVLSVNEVIKSSNLKGISLKAPFIEQDKEDIVKAGVEFGVDFRKTISCYFGDQGSCGKCLACMLRKEGFYWAGLQDPTDYIKK